MDNNNEGLAFLQKAFEERGLRYVPSVANFVLVEVGDGDSVFAAMLSRGVIVRDLSSREPTAASSPARRAAVGGAA